MKIIKFVGTFFLLSTLAACAHNKATPAKSAMAAPEQVRNTLNSMTGCFLVDYSYVEMDAIKKGYKRDARVYDVNKTKAVKEWIYSEETGPNNIRLQHILFATDENGKFMPGSELKHQAEDWEYEAPIVYDFVTPFKWMPVSQQPGNGKWTRKITNLDDGLRYQCASQWKTTGTYPEWSCDNYAPIPGRETRDMQRKDYNALQRSTRIIAYGDSFLERQFNTKVIDKNGKQTPLVKETGKIWFVRVPNNDCSEAQAFAKPRREFWALLKNTWNEVYKEGQPFTEVTAKGQPPRFAKMMEVEAAYLDKDLSKPEIRNEAKMAILKTINDYRSKGTAPATKASY